jgi:hypothetical protein
VIGQGLEGWMPKKVDEKQTLVGPEKGKTAAFSLIRRWLK